jgi:hypothetical protein
MDLQIIAGSPNKIQGEVVDGSTGTHYSVQSNITATRLVNADVKTEDASGTYVFWLPAWDWWDLTACGLSGSFWANGFVYQAKNGGECRKINMQGANSQVRIGCNATGYVACGTQLW